jgi:hypothetical protein
MEELSKLRQQIFAFNKKRTLLLTNIMKTEPFIAAQVYERFKKCGNKNCKCSRGELHGPFTWLYQNKKGQKLISTTVKKEFAPEALKYAENYKLLLEQRKQVREIDEQINLLITQIEIILERDASIYVAKKKATEGRSEEN